jgi:hypothetical protein
MEPAGAARTGRYPAAIVRARALAVVLLAAAAAAPARAEGATTPVRPADDAYVHEARPQRNFGEARHLRAGASPRTLSYLRFRLPRLEGVVRRATLRLLPVVGSRHSLTVRTVRSDRWEEGAITHQAAPRAGRVVARSARVRAERWLSIDVTAALRDGRRTVSLVVSGPSRRAVRIYSRHTGPSRAPRLIVTTTPDRRAPVPPVVVAAGDIACSPRSRFRGSSHACRDRHTASVLADLDMAAVLALGDLQYEEGDLAAFREVYDRSWGRFKDLTRPAVGNHEYLTPAATGYFDYFNGVGAFGGRAGDRDKGYYSFDIGTWHVVALNSVCDAVGGCHAGSPQEAWLRADLAAHRARCTLAYWHHPRFSSGQQRSSLRFVPFWQALYDAGADVVLAGHAHDYERFAPLTPTGEFDAVRGIRQFVVGTGGKFLYGFEAIEPYSEARDAVTHGVLELSLGTAGYEWRFLPERIGTFTDSGTGTCHD